MMSLLVLVVGLSLAHGQTTGESCLNPCACKNVTIDPNGLVLDPDNSPYYAVMSSNVTGFDEYDGSCIAYFDLGDSIFLVIQTVVNKNGTYSIIKSIRGNVAGSPGAYRYQGIDPTLECGSCVYNDFTFKSLQGECGGLYLIYRCPIYGECVSTYGGQDIVYLVQTALLTSPPPSCCDITAASLTQQQGLSPLFSLPNKLRRYCVTSINGLTAINAGCVAPENSIQIDTTKS